jgi:hypothetical protein
LRDRAAPDRIVAGGRHEDNGLQTRPGRAEHRGVDALPPADPSLLPAMREQGGELGRQFVDVFVGFRLHFHDDGEASAFARHFRFASTRSALRQEGGGTVWVGFHGWAFDAGDAQMQAALAVRHSAVRARVRHIPGATDAEIRPTGKPLLQPDKARRERDELLARLSDDVPQMLNTNRLALGPGARHIAEGRRQAAQGPRRSTAPPSAGPPPAAPLPAGDGKPSPRRRRLFGR